MNCISVSKIQKQKIFRILKYFVVCAARQKFRSKIDAKSRRARSNFVRKRTRGRAPKRAPLIASRTGYATLRGDREGCNFVNAFGSSRRSGLSFGPKTPTRVSDTLPPRKSNPPPPQNFSVPLTYPYIFFVPYALETPPKIVFNRGEIVRTENVQVVHPPIQKIVVFNNFGAKTYWEWRSRIQKLIRAWFCAVATLLMGSKVRLWIFFVRLRVQTWVFDTIPPKV